MHSCCCQKISTGNENPEDKENDETGNQMFAIHANRISI